MSIEDDQRTIETWTGEGLTEHGKLQMDYFFSREVLNRELHVTWVDRILAPEMPVKSIYRRYPWYGIENNTEAKLTLLTYPDTYFPLHALTRQLTLEVDLGIQYLDAYTFDT